METRENKRRQNSVSDSRTRMDSPLRAHSPLQSDDPDTDPPFSTPEASPAKSPCNAMVPVDKLSHLYRSQQPKQAKSPSPPPPPPPPGPTNAIPINAAPLKSPTKSPTVPTVPPLVVFNRAVREDMTASVTKMSPGGGRDVFGDGVGGGVVGDDGGGERRSGRAVTSILRRSKREEMVRKAALAFRVCEVVLCLISFSVMAADKTQGWSGDSFDRYREYRYCLAVTVIAFVYSGFQAYDLAYNLITGKHVIGHHLRSHFDFFMDQTLAYLLISASSAAATRVDDWQSNWGKDEFTEMASASVSLSFLAFIAFAVSSLISGYDLCTRNLN